MEETRPHFTAIAAASDAPPRRGHSRGRFVSLDQFYRKVPMWRHITLRTDDGETALFDTADPHGTLAITPGWCLRYRSQTRDVGSPYRNLIADVLRKSPEALR
jgi:hypothetical protein